MKTQTIQREHYAATWTWNIASVWNSHSGLRQLAAMLCFVVLLTGLGFATNNNPYFAFRGQAAGPDTYEYKFEFINTAGQTVNIQLAVLSLGQISDSTLAGVIKDRLNSLDNVKGEYRFSAFQSDKSGWWYVYGVPQQGKKPTPVKDGVKISRGDATLVTGAGIDPAGGYATFSLSGTPTGGQIYLGVNGLYVSDDTTYSDGTPKSLSQIESELLNQFLEMGFPSAGIDSSTGVLWLSGVGSGDPTTDDTGAAVMSTDDGVGVSADMQLGAVEMQRPRRGTVTLSPTSGAVGTRVTVSISGFPANSDISITFYNGQQVTTITTNAGGTGTGSFVVPQAAMGTWEVRAAGGTPVTFGYAWFTVR
jgi:hypothetical protein